MNRPTLLSVFVLTLSLSTPPSARIDTLRQAAGHAGILIGTAVRPSLFSEAAYSETLAREYNMVEPEDAMKWSVVRRAQEKFDFREGDAVVQFAQAHNMKVRGHCLVWDHDNPDWLTKNNLSALSRILKDHITTMMTHYSGQVFAWDVVNEAIDENGRLRDSIWNNRPGIGLSGMDTTYIEQAFRWARAADAQALLFYNDNSGEGLGRKSDAIYAMLKVFKQRHVPIDGVGLQMHLSLSDFDAASVSSNIARLTALGLQVHISELDVPLTLAPGGLARVEDLQRQADVYRAVARTCLQNPGCTAIQTWGFTDKYSWIGSHSHGIQGAALPFDRSYQPKPAYAAILAEISYRQPSTMIPQR